MTEKIDTNKILQKILTIEPENEFLRYIVNRVQDDDYRGWRSSQHNRYDITDVTIILEKLSEIAGDGLVKTPLGDHKGKTLLDEFADYSNLISLISSGMRSKKNDEKAKGTIDSLKKNFFVDFHRMGLIHRFDKNKQETDPWGRQHVHYVSLSTTGMEFVNNVDLSNRFYLLTRGIDKLFENQMEGLLNAIYYSDFRHEKIGIFEMMFIFTDPKLSNEQKIELLKSFRSLHTKRKKVVALIKSYAQPENFDGNKTVKKDFHNWKNKIQQILYLFRNTIYFDADEKGFILNVGALGIVPEVKQRSQTAKDRYFREHGLSKQNSFELHHIIPFRFARDKHEFKLIDDYKNLIYLHKGKHKEITINNDRHLVLSINEDIATFTDFKGNIVSSSNGENAMYSRKEKILNSMNKHNVELLKSVFEFES